MPKINISNSLHSLNCYNHIYTSPIHHNYSQSYFHLSHVIILMSTSSFPFPYQLPTPGPPCLCLQCHLWLQASFPIGHASTFQSIWCVNVTSIFLKHHSNHVTSMRCVLRSFLFLTIYNLNFHSGFQDPELSNLNGCMQTDHTVKD